ncbi:NAD(P)H-hydrate dehydratase [Candidatus Nitrosopelagicus sp.]|nr:NAD(P)H-hydrate dehydratase [Candidatus Nitrosopelagicus sp.]
MKSETLTKSIIKGFMLARNKSSRKGDNGKVLVVGGSYVYHGAPVLSSLAALRTGTDLVYTAVPKNNVQATRAISPDLIVIPLADAKLTRGSVNKLLGQIPKDLDSATIGMGLAIQDIEALKILVKSLLNRDVRLSLDASALVKSILPLIKGKNVVVTPHAGEFYRLFGEELPSEKKNHVKFIEKVAKKYSVTILLKGQTDIISDGERTFQNSKTESSAMTVGGTGDVLSGIISGLLARNRNPLESAAIAAYLNGLCGKYVQKEIGVHMVASDLINALPYVAKTFDKIK